MQRRARSLQAALVGDDAARRCRILDWMSKLMATS